MTPTMKRCEDTIFQIVVHANVPYSNRKIQQAAQQLGIEKVTACYEERLFFIKGNVTREDATTLAHHLLADPINETYTISDVGATQFCVAPSAFFVDVTWLPGVTDPAAENLCKSAELLNVTGLQQAATGHHYRLEGDLSERDLHRIAAELLSNPVVQQVSINAPIEPPFVAAASPDATVETIVLTDADEDELEAISRERRLSLDRAEMVAIQTYYRSEGREPTDIELEMLAQTWSEHCVHKTFRALIEYTGPDGATQTIDGLLKQYIRKATETVDKSWVRSAFVDNAGIVKFDEQFDLAFKVETHNHPSALEPFGGANTGVGGCVRDVLGVSARPIANTDILCFGLPDLSADKLPDGVLHPSRIADGVIAGIEDYGNKMGIPTVNGAIVYHEGYTANPLVYVGCLGILPHGSHPTQVNAGDLIVSIGGRTGRDGLRGATFSSMEMDSSTSEIAGTAVQIGHPIQEKKVQEVVLRARDARLYSAITDCGAGGFSSAVGEMAEGLGARVDLNAVTLKYPGLRPWEIWLSEAQERMVLAVPAENWVAVEAIAKSQDVEAIVLGTFEATGKIELFYNDELVGELATDFLHDGIPQRQLKAKWEGVPRSENGETSTINDGQHADVLLKLLAHPNIRSKEAVVRLYDHEVQSGTAVKPFVGVANQGPSDAAVIAPLDTQQTGVRGAALGNGICPEFGSADPYIMAWAAVDEALRNVVAVGADPDQVSILDNFCWGNPLLEDRLGALVRCTQGCHDAAVAYGTPFVSGKDSLNNEYTGADGKKHAIPGTILISALGIVPDVTQAVTMDFKSAGNAIYVIGETGNALAGSHYALVADSADSHTLPTPNPDALTRFRRLHRAMRAGLIASCHDCSEGGLAVTLAEMALAGRIGAEIDLEDVPASADLTPTQRLFSESLSRFVVEVTPENMSAFEALFADDTFGQIGMTTVAATLNVTDHFELTLDTLETAWRGSIAPTPITQPTTTQQYPAIQQIGAPKVLILHANGTNRDRDAALACSLAGGDPEIVHINQLMSGERSLLDYGMVVVPGGFSYGDDLGAGVLFSAELQHRFGKPMAQFVASDRPVLGICNGFQTLVKAGLLPGGTTERDVTLTYNERGHFECRWTYLLPNPASPSIFTQGLTEPIYCPVAHGEGRFVVRNEQIGQQLRDKQLIALSYEAGYPHNPNGSMQNIAGICNEAGNVLGLMPHPENHVFAWQHPRGTRGERGNLGLWLFVNGVNYARR